MTLFNINSREIRSFRLRFLTQNFYSFFTDKESSGIFMSCDSVQPGERIMLRSEFFKNNLEVLYIGKNISRFVFFSKKWKNIRNLLQGGVVLIKERFKNSISIEKIKFIFLQKKFYFRFIFWFFSFYRWKRLEVFLKQINKNNQNAFLFFLLFYIKWQSNKVSKKMLEIKKLNA